MEHAKKYWKYKKNIFRHSIHVLSLFAIIIHSCILPLYAKSSDTITIISDDKSIISHIPINKNDIKVRDKNSKEIKGSAMYTIIGNPKKIAQSKTLPSGQYKSIFSIGEDSYDIQFAYPISIETQTDLPDGNNAIIYTSQDNINRSYHGYGSTSNGMTTFSTDHFTYFAVGDISGHFVINNNNTHTNTGNVTLNNNIAGAVSMRFGNTPAARDAASWESYSSNKSWNLGGIPGVHTVYAAFQNDIGDIVTVSDDIIWEDVPPSSFDTTNLRMWYDVADVSTITQSAGLVSQRRDKSGYANHANGIANVNRPTRLYDVGVGMNVLDFDGTSDFLAIQNIFYNSASINGLFICTVFKTAYSATSYNSNRSFIDFDRSEFYDFYIQGNGKLELSYTAGGSTIDAPVTAGGTYNDNQRHFACGHYDNTVVNDTEIYVDGIREYVANRRATGVKIGKNTTRYGFIGDGSEASSYNSTRNNIYYDGQIGEIIVFDDLTTTAQREEVMCYLSSKRSIADACDGVGVPPIATIEYSTTETTPGPIVATLTGFSEPVTITNNGGSPYYSFTDNGSFTFTYQDASGNIGSTTATVTWISSSASISMIAGGYIPNLNQNRKTIYFDRSYTTPPIVIATPTTDNNGNNSPFVRLRNITTESFQIRTCIDNGSSTCANGTNEDISYTVWDRAMIASNPTIDAGTISATTNGSVTSLTFNKTFANAPYVFLTPQTDSQGINISATTWAKDITTSTANIVACLHNGGGDVCQTGQPNETIGYIAFDPASFSYPDFQQGNQNIGASTWTNISYTPYINKPLINVAINTENGGQDPVYPWARNVTASTAQIRYCEQDGANDCDTHSAEATRWMTLPEPSQPSLTITTPTSLSIGYQVQSYNQNISKTFTGQYFRLTDNSGYNIGRYTTISISNFIGPETISGSAILFQGGPITKLNGMTNASIINHITTPTDISTPVTYLERPTGPNGLKTGTYGSTPTLNTTLPAYITPGTYTGTITYTLYEYSEIQ